MNQRIFITMAAIPSFASADWSAMENGYGHMSGYGSVAMAFTTVLIIGLLNVAIFWATRKFYASGQSDNTSDSAVETVRMRFAKGEISESEMEAILQKLK